MSRSLTHRSPLSSSFSYPLFLSIDFLLKSARTIENHTTKGSVQNDSDWPRGEMNNRCNSGACGAKFPAGYAKRLEKLNAISVKGNGQTNPTSNCKLEPKIGGPLSSLQTTLVSYSSDPNRSVRAFCHSSKLTNGSGPMMCYANGKIDVATFSNIKHIHQKCMEWIPQLYYEGETTMNMESELARAAKLKCSSCGLS